MTTDDLQKLHNDELSRLAAEAQGWHRVEPPDERCGYWKKISDKHLGRTLVYGLSDYSPPTNLPQATELFMGMSEDQRQEAWKTIEIDTLSGPEWCRRLLDPRQLTIACLAAMEVES